MPKVTQQVSAWALGCHCRWAPSPESWRLPQWTCWVSVGTWQVWASLERERDDDELAALCEGQPERRGPGAAQPFSLLGPLVTGLVRLSCWEAASGPWVAVSFPVCRPGNPGLLGLLVLSQVTRLPCDSTQPLSLALSRPPSFPRGGTLRPLAALLPEPPGWPRTQAGQSLQPAGCFWPSWAFPRGLLRAVGLDEDWSVRAPWAGRQPCPARCQERGLRVGWDPGAAAGVNWDRPLLLSEPQFAHPEMG